MALSRRELLASGVTAAIGPLTPTGRDTATRTLRGTIAPGAPDWVYLPLDVPPGTAELRISYTYAKPPVPPGTPGNALDIGIFDQRGTGLGDRGFRGWSGGARGEFFLRADAATPGYLPGPVEPGRWHVALGPYTVAPEGLTYEITATFTYGDPGTPAVPAYPPQRARGRGRAWYRGDCHLHSVHSDGRRTPAELAALARAAGLDFINSSEHNTHAAHAAWGPVAAAEPDLLVLTGEEITTRTGHVVAVGPRTTKWPSPPGTPPSPPVAGRGCRSSRAATTTATPTEWGARRRWCWPRTCPARRYWPVCAPATATRPSPRPCRWPSTR